MHKLNCLEISLLASTNSCKRKAAYIKVHQDLELVVVY